MRNDARKERRLPGFFDQEVYDILEGRCGAGVRGTGGNNAAAPRMDLDDVDGKEREKPVLGSGASATGGLFSSSSDEDDDDNNDDADTAPPVPTPAQASAPVSVPISENTAEVPRQESSEQAGALKRKVQDELTEDSPVQGRQKRQRSGDEASARTTTDLQGELIHILDRSGRMVAAQLEAQNINNQLDREQRKDQTSSLLGVLGKMADALYRIADKL